MVAVIHMLEKHWIGGERGGATDANTIINLRPLERSGEETKAERITRGQKGGA